MFEISHNLKKFRVLVYLWIYQHGSYKNYGYVHLNLTRNNVNKTQNNLRPSASVFG